MKENEFIDVIKQLSKNDYIGDDCAYLKELGIVISQDSLLENIHFKREWYNSFQLGYKAAAVNISDILASGGCPKYLTVGLSLPKNIDTTFIEEFYKGINSVSSNVRVIGGDITGSDGSIYISITAIGTDNGRKISSRKDAKSGYVIVTKGMHGSSSKGLEELLSNNFNGGHVLSHIAPTLEFDFSKQIATNIKEDYAMMDTSDGLADALFKIAKSSKVSINIDYNKVPHETEVSYNNVLFGGEDYKLIAAIPEKYLNCIEGAIVIGHVKEFDGTYLRIDNQSFNAYDEMEVYNHFGK